MNLAIPKNFKKIKSFVSYFSRKVFKELKHETPIREYAFFAGINFFPQPAPVFVSLRFLYSPPFLSPHNAA